MKRIILIWTFIQVILAVEVYGQDDSSAVQPPEAPAILLAPDSPAPKPVKKEVPPVKPIKQVQVQVQPAKDSVPSYSPAIDSFSATALYGNAILPYINNHPYYSISKDVMYTPSKEYSPESKDELFYVFCAMLLFLGILKIGFSKYFYGIFNVFWRSAFHQNQIRDQLQQAGMTTLLFNIFFAFSSALFGYLAIRYTTGDHLQPWLLFTICFFCIALIYTGKYFILKVSGWIFDQKAVVDSYIFIVFLTNKVLSILLIPLMLVLAFGSEIQQQVAFTISVILILSLLAYRFVLSFNGFRNELRISLLHLALYVGGFEIIPVLVIYKLLLRLFVRSL